MSGIDFYPTVSYGELGKYTSTHTALLPASSWAGAALRRQEKRGDTTDYVIGRIPVPTIPAHLTERAADCGGFVASFKWGGVYKYSVEQYVEWLHAWQPTWAAVMDFCCEDEITSGRPGIVRERQQKTLDMARHFWQEYKGVPWAWVPTIQGWTLEDYAWHVERMKPLIMEMHAHYGPDSAFRVGIGTLCARASATMIRQVVQLVAEALPGIPLHLWGVKLSTFQSSIALPEQVTSCDSAAWNGLFRTGRENWKQSGLSQRQYVFQVALPAYEQKLHAALTTPKQLTLGEIA